MLATVRCWRGETHAPLPSRLYRPSRRLTPVHAGRQRVGLHRRHLPDSCAICCVYTRAMRCGAQARRFTEEIVHAVRREARQQCAESAAAKRQEKQRRGVAHMRRVQARSVKQVQ